MGVKGLQSTLLKYGNPVDLIRLAKQQARPLTILADFYAFSFYLSETFTSYAPDEDLLLDVDALRRYEFCELHKVRAIIWVFIEVLKRNNIAIEFIGDGAYKLGTEEGNTKQAEWQKRAVQRFDGCRSVERAFLTRRAETARNVYTSNGGSFTLPPMFNSQMQHTIRAMGLPIWFCEGEADKLIAEVSRRRAKSTGPLSALTPIFGVLSNDTDFSLMNGCHFLLANAFDPQKRLVAVVSKILQNNREHVTNPVFTKFRIDEANPSHQLTSLTGHLFSPEVVARSLRVKVDMLPEISMLAGNDFTKPFVEELRHLASRSPRGSSRVEQIPKVKSAMQSDHAFQRAVQFSRVFYGYEVTEDGLNSDISQREIDEYIEYRLPLEGCQKRQSACGDPVNNDNQENDRRGIMGRNCCWGVFPRFALQVVEGKTYWVQCRLEFFENSQYGFDDACVAFRQYLYAVFGMSPQTPIVEYGRAKANLCAVLTQYPKEIPTSLTWHGVREASKKDPQAYKKAISTLLLKIVQDSGSSVTKIDPSLKMNMSTMFLTILDSLRFGADALRYRVFLPHEIESILVMTVLCVMRVPRNAELSELEREMVEMFRIADSTRNEIVNRLFAARYLESSDPIGFIKINKSHKVQKRNPHLNGLVCGFRSLVVFGWLQAVWFYIMDLMSMMYGSATGLRSVPSCALVLDGNVFRWVYAAGAMDFKTNHSIQVEAASECVPIEVSPEAAVQVEFVKCLRSMLLNTREVKELLNFFGDKKV